MAAEIEESVRRAIHEIVTPTLDQLAAQIASLGREVGVALATVKAGDEALRGDIAAIRAELATFRGASRGLHAEATASVAGLQREVHRAGEQLAVVVELCQHILALGTTLGT